MKKLLTIFTACLMLTVFCLGMTACTKEKDKYADLDSDKNWDKKTYVFYVFNGETPVEGIKLALCYNVSDTESKCMTAKATNADGRVSFDIPAEDTAIGDPVIHFVASYATGSYGLPAGCELPEDVTTVTMNCPEGQEANFTYEAAKKVSVKVTKFYLK